MHINLGTHIIIFAVSLARGDTTWHVGSEETTSVILIYVHTADCYNRLQCQVSQ